MGKFGNRFEAHAVQPGKAFWTNSRDMFYRKRPEELLFLTWGDPQHVFWFTINRSDFFHELVFGNTYGGIESKSVAYLVANCFGCF